MEPLRLEGSSRSNQFEASLLRTQVFNLINQLSFKKGDFVLASGKKSKFYLDMKPTMFSPEGATRISLLILQRLNDLKVDYIGGLAMGAVPLVANASMMSFEKGRPIPGFFVRKEVKNHGTKKLVEALSDSDLKNKNVVILDDVTTTGESAMIAVEAAQRAGANILLVLSVVDREEGAVDFYKNKKIPFGSLFVASEFLNA